MEINLRPPEYKTEHLPLGVFKVVIWERDKNDDAK
jgi:hypothetical protein